MFGYIKDITSMIDKRVLMIESNKTAPCSKEEILKTNIAILKLIESGYDRLVIESCDKKLIEKYAKIIKNIVL